MSMNNQVVAAEGLKVVLIYTEKLGISSTKILQEAGLRTDMPELNRHFISMAEFSRFFAAACKLANDPYLGLHIGDHSNLDALGIVGQLYRYSRNTIEGTHRITKYLPLIHTIFVYELAEKDKEIAIRLTPGYHSEEATFANRQIIELAMAFTRQGIQDGTQSNINPLEAHFVWPLSTAEEAHYASILQCPVKGTQLHNELIYDKTAASIPHVFYDPILLKALEASANAGLQFSPWSSNDLQKALLIMNAEEKERSRIARDLHDGVCGTLAAVKMHLSAVQAQYPGGESADFRQALQLLDQVSDEVRKTAHSLMPEVLQNYGLEEALKRYCQSLAPCCAATINYYSSGEPARFEKGFELATYRIAQELLHNAIRHAQAQNVLVQLSLDEDMVLTIEDDGIGFRKEQLSPGSGLDNLQQHVNSLGGAICWESNEGEGTSVTITFPDTHRHYKI
ncbi:AraC family transcriptional regulator ligand-binding domain-containing protein [Paraflavitalea sp. CAU 1676]|uniref:AraC family transcriptional regulator ligand-binding domain-containing protein n=1 Tax=Paraflavitalea sp. CAU 1676 TaxID=3032598 RepID=UPI0023DB0998|nr:AraC family transcriptional regulator ligand-binding domain-containing protein [Paraflavitalea sp. CAU 1676]MDF2189112.1 AraC family transcriptional regulator ligand-binding domain-containing protein [Paraflavitalea sp. CAU 1676]